VPRVAHIFALAGVLCVSISTCRSESLPPREIPIHQKTLVVFLTSDSAIAPGAFSEIQKEVSHLLQPAAIHVDWRDPAIDREGVENDYSAVIRLRGTCSSTEPGTRFQHAVSGPYTLASSAVAEGVILPFADIDCAALNSFLGPALWKEPDPVREFVYARAVARLMAHELYHVVGQTSLHARSGISGPAFTVAELLSEHFDFTESAVTELQAYSETGEYSGRTEFDEASGK